MKRICFQNKNELFCS